MAKNFDTRYENRPDQPHGLFTRLGWTPGVHKCWCAACERTFAGQEGSFKCKVCVDKDIRLIHVDELAYGSVKRVLRGVPK